MTELTDRECGEIVAASLAPDRILSGIDGHKGSRPDVLLTTVDRILTDRLAAARAEGARDMRTKIEELADDFHDRSQSHAWPTPSSMAYRDAWRTASTVLRALLADGGEPNG